jgi:hypothetical protein|tara:strand:- start:4885 stop:5079 length:195 start_codon:yes stop_codon:yes gene_type:complete
MEDSWTQRDRKVATRRRRKEMGGKFKDKEERDKVRGKQRKIFNQIRRHQNGDDTHEDTEGVDNE